MFYGDYPGVRAAVFHSPKFLVAVPAAGRFRWIVYFYAIELGEK